MLRPAVYTFYAQASEQTNRLTGIQWYPVVSNGIQWYAC